MQKKSRTFQCNPPPNTPRQVLQVVRLVKDEDGVVKVDARHAADAQVQQVAAAGAVTQ